jgi:uncharacterized protein
LAKGTRLKNKKCKTCRALRYRLLIPILRGKNTPKITARGVMVGLAVAFTPTVGAQMAICAAIWAVVRAVRPSWNFNLIVACGWTWITNFFTVPPIYYGFLITGRLMLAPEDGLYGYSDFMGELNMILATETTGFESFWVYMVRMVELWGLPMVIGSIPWSIVLGWVGYFWSLRVIENFRTSQRQHLIEH